MSAHNPDGLLPSQVGVADGWRLLDEDERGDASFKSVKAVRDIEVWDNGWFAGQEGFMGNGAEATYRTKMTRAELRAARGLTPEFRVNITPVSSVDSEVSRTLEKQTETILGIPWRQYLAQQFPATVGHIPLEEFIRGLIQSARLLPMVSRALEQRTAVEVGLVLEARNAARKELLDYMQSMPGSSWIATISDVEEAFKAIDDARP